jgi:hypothetical protein
MERRSSTARPRRYDNAEQADHQPSDGVASALPGTAPRRGVICRYPPCGRRGPATPPRQPRHLLGHLSPRRSSPGRAAVAASTRWVEACFSAVSQPSPPWTEKRRIQSSPSFRAPLGARAWPPRSPQLGPVRHVLFARMRVMRNTSPDLGRRWRPFIEGPAAIRVVTVVVLPRFWAKNSAGGHSVP